VAVVVVVVLLLLQAYLRTYFYSHGGLARQPEQQHSRVKSKANTHAQVRGTGGAQGYQGAVFSYVDGAGGFCQVQGCRGHYSTSATRPGVLGSSTGDLPVRCVVWAGQQQWCHPQWCCVLA
jgi:hypothetical protein